MFDGKLFEDVMNNSPDGIVFSKEVREELYDITKDAVWKTFMMCVEKEDLLVHVECNLPDREFRSIIFFKVTLYDRLFGKLVAGQHLKELARFINVLMDEIDTTDWAQFVLDIIEEKG